MAFGLEKLWHFAWKNCGILLGKIVAFYMQFDIHKNLYFLRICGNFNISKIAFLLGMPSVVCSGAALFVHKGTFHAPMVRFMRRSRYLG